MIAILGTAVVAGFFWSIQAWTALSGLGPSFPRSRETEISYIRSRVSYPLVRPEWIERSGVSHALDRSEWIESDELEKRWLAYECGARMGLTMFAALATIYIARSVIQKK